MLADGIWGPGGQAGRQAATWAQVSGMGLLLLLAVYCLCLAQHIGAQQVRA